jgi:hypothetical protein
MARANEHAALVAEMLGYVPAAVPGAVSLQRCSGSLRPGYSLRYLRTREPLRMGKDAPGVETVEFPIAAAWSVHFIVGIVLILLGIALALLLPPATHEGLLALIAGIFVLFGVGELWQSHLTPVGPDRLSLANAVMRARLEALRTDNPREITKRVAKEREISNLLFHMALPSRYAGPRSWPAEWSRGDKATTNRDRDSA